MPSQVSFIFVSLVCVLFEIHPLVVLLFNRIVLAKQQLLLQQKNFFVKIQLPAISRFVFFALENKTMQ